MVAKSVSHYHKEAAGACGFMQSEQNETSTGNPVSQFSDYHFQVKTSQQLLKL
jgi:hypothetical protein